MLHSNKNSSSTSDPRVQVTQTIWGYAIGMFALCIPLTALSRGAIILPVAVAVGAGAGTVAIWRSDSRSQQKLESDRTIRLLEERIANLETIASHGELNVQRQFRALELQDRSESEREFNHSLER